MMVARVTLTICAAIITLAAANIEFKHHNNTELAAILQQDHNQCPDISRLYTLSEPSVRGVPLYVLEFSDKPGHHELTEPEMKYVVDPPYVISVDGNSEFPEVHASFLVGPTVLEGQRNDIRLFVEALNSAQLEASPYVIVCEKRVGIRSCPSCDDWARTGKVLHPGSCIVVDQEENGYLKLHDGSGWIFQQKGEVEVAVIMEKLELGAWWYRSTDFVQVRQAPTTQSELRSGWFLVDGEMVVVVVRCCIGGERFFQLADGRGWIAEADRNTAKVAMHESGGELLMECQWNEYPSTNTVVDVGLWRYKVVATKPVIALGENCNGTLVEPGMIVGVDKRCYAGGRESECETQHIRDRRWLRLAGQCNWVPERGKDGNFLLKLYNEEEAPRSHWFFPLKKPEAEWMVGVV